MSERRWTAPETGWYQFGPDVPPDAIGRYLANFVSEPAAGGPPYVHAFAFESEPEAVITKLGWLTYNVSIHHGLGATMIGWNCLGRRWAESKARRELRKYVREPASYTLTL